MLITTIQADYLKSMPFIISLKETSSKRKHSLVLLLSMEFLIKNALSSMNKPSLD
jgi:hypothetical protein